MHAIDDNHPGIANAIANGSHQATVTSNSAVQQDGEPLTGSGFENEQPEPDFDERS